MKTVFPRYAGFVAAILALLLIVGVFAIFGTVDLVYMKEGYEVGRQENVSLISDIELYVAPGETEPGAFSYTYGGNRYVVNEGCANLKEHIVYTVITNAFTFKWSDEANDFVLNAE